MARSSPLSGDERAGKMSVLLVGAPSWGPNLPIAVRSGTGDCGSRRHHHAARTLLMTTTKPRLPLVAHARPRYRRPMLDHLKANNRAWAERMVSADAGFFLRLERQQA